MTAPLPPRDLSSRDPLLVEIPKGTTLHRFYSAAYDPIYFDRSELGRFNAPDGSYGVLLGRSKRLCRLVTAIVLPVSKLVKKQQLQQDRSPACSRWGTL